MKNSSIKDLEIYQASIEISDKIWNMVIPWDDFVKRTIGSQLVRAVDSVGANIAEGYGRGSKLDNARFVKIARGSLFETKYWLNQANTRKLLSNDDLTEIIAKIETLLPRISAYINYLSKSSQKR